MWTKNKQQDIKYYRKILRRKTLQIALGLFSVVLFLIINQNHFYYINSILTRLDGLIYDTQINLSIPAKPAPLPSVVIIDIDDYSVKKEGRWPWPRNKIGKLIEQLKKSGAILVVFDIVFSEPERNLAQELKERISALSGVKPDQPPPDLLPFLNKITPEIDGDIALAKALNLSDSILGFLFQYDPLVKTGAIPPPLRNDRGILLDGSLLSLPKFEGYIGSLPLLLKAVHGHAGFVSNIPDIDGIIRHSLLLANFDNQIYSSLALTTAMHYFFANTIRLTTEENFGRDVLTGIDVGGVFIPTTEKGQMLLPYPGRAGTARYFSASDVLAGKVTSDDISGNIALVGSTLVLLADLHPSPVAQTFPGVEMTANAISAIINNSMFTPFNWHLEQGMVILSLIGLFFSLLFPFLGPISLFVVYFLALIGVETCCGLLFNYHKIYVPSANLLAMITLQGFINFLYSFNLERQQKNHMRQLFGQYVPPSYVKEITDFPEHYHMEGETREMTVLFSDIRNFTSLSENLDAIEVKRLLNTLFTPITEIIFAHHGTIDKYVGDMVMAFWGAPINDPRHAFHAISASLAIQKNLEKINQEIIKLSLPPVQIGIGINSGLMNVGDMGSKFRRAYTVIGDSVNLASRVQDLTPFYHVNILVSEYTRQDQNNFAWQFVDNVAVKGRQQGVKIYELLGLKNEINSELWAELQFYDEGIEAYYSRDWLRARETFLRLRELNPGKYLYGIYLDRIKEFELNPPPEDWNGVFVHTHK